MSNTTTIRVNRKIYLTIKNLADSQNETIQDVLEEALNEYKKKKFFEELNTAYIREKAQNQDLIDNELLDWDNTVSDGLEEEEWGYAITYYY